MTWGKRKIAGTEYNLSHLNPFILPVNLGKRSVRIQVSFGAHAFTREFAKGDTPDLRFMDGSVPRTFCIDRYGHSLRLPEAVCQAVEGLVCLSKNQLVLNTSLPGLSGPYLVVFDIRKDARKRFDAKLHVRTAHHRPNLNQKLPYAKFRVVLENVISGRPIRWTKK
jgi:hypothetical protein